MKKQLLFFYIIFSAISFVNAQKKDGKNYEQIQTLKVNYISSELGLTPSVAEKFWPIFNEYEVVNRKLRSTKIKGLKKEIDAQGNIDSLSDSEALEYSNQFLNSIDEYARNKRNTFDKLAEILSPQQLLKLHIAEMEFNHKVLRKLHHEKK